MACPLLPDAGYPWISTTSIDLNPLSDSVLRYNFFDFPVPTKEEEKYDIVALSLVMNYEGSLINRGALRPWLCVVARKHFPDPFCFLLPSFSLVVCLCPVSLLLSHIHTHTRYPNPPHGDARRPHAPARTRLPPPSRVPLPRLAPPVPHQLSLPLARAPHLDPHFDGVDRRTATRLGEIDVLVTEAEWGGARGRRGQGRERVEEGGGEEGGAEEQFLYSGAAGETDRQGRVG